MPFGFRRTPLIHVDLRTRDGFSGVHKLTDMIFDTLDQLNRYRGLGPRFARAFDFVKTLDVNTPDGRIDLEGDDLFVLVQSYQTQPEERKEFEKTSASSRSLSGTMLRRWASDSGATLPR